MIIKNLRESREILDIKQKDVADLFSVNFTTVSGWETGKDTIPLKRLIEYANHFNYSLDYLFGITRYNDSSYLTLEIDLDFQENVCLVFTHKIHIHAEVQHWRQVFIV